jgi:hypothetical protein
MKRFVQGEDRTQGTLLPELLDDYVAADNPVRVIEVFVDELDLGKLGFQGVDPQATGRPAYHPATLLRSISSNSGGIFGTTAACTTALAFCIFLTGFGIHVPFR